jgi:hypothetical protein
MGLTHSPQQFRAVQLWEHQIKDEQIVLVGVDIGFALATIACEVYRESFGAQSASHELGQFTIIFDNEYSHRDSLNSTSHAAVLSPVHAAKDLLRGLSHHGAELLSTRRNAAMIAGCGRRIAGTD